ncbi:MAG: glycosyltransferase [Balneola sp.]
MDICFYIYNMNGGGAERVFLNLMNHSVDCGHSVHLILNKKEGPYLEFLNPEISVHELGSKSVKGSIGGLGNVLKQVKPDLILSTLSQCNYAMILAKFLKFRKATLFIREANSFLSQRQHLSKFRLLYERLKAGILYRFADRILVNSVGSKNELTKATYLSENSISILPNPVDVDGIREKAEEDLQEQIDSFLQDTPYIISIGRLQYAKAFDNLIRAFKKADNLDKKLIILGEGKLRDELQNLIDSENLSDKVLLAGHMENPYPIISNSRLFVLSSRYEGMPNVLLEAFILMKPIVSTDCPSGPRELLRNGDFGVLVPTESVDELSSAIDTEFDNMISHEERELYIEQFRIKNVYSSLLKLYDEPKGT